MSLGKPEGLAWTVAVLGSGSASPARTVRRAVMVQVSPTERVPSAFELTMKVLAASRRLPRSVSVTVTLLGNLLNADDEGVGGIEEVAQERVGNRHVD